MTRYPPLPQFLQPLLGPFLLGVNRQHLLQLPFRFIHALGLAPHSRSRMSLNNMRAMYFAATAQSERKEDAARFSLTAPMPGCIV